MSLGGTRDSVNESCENVRCPLSGPLRSPFFVFHAPPSVLFFALVVSEGGLAFVQVGLAFVQVGPTLIQAGLALLELDRARR